MPVMNPSTRLEARVPPTSGTKASLRTLTPVQVSPEWRTDSASLTSILLRVEHVEVHRCPNTREQMYTLNVFFDRPESRIPTSRRWKLGRRRSSSSPTPSSSHVRTQGLQVHHSIAEFAALRDSLHSCVQTSHQGAPCSFCERLCNFFSYGSGRPMAFTSLLYELEIDASSVLVNLLTTLVDECRELLLSDERRQGCRGQRHAPYLLHAFLHPQSMGHETQ